MNIFPRKALQVAGPMDLDEEMRLTVADRLPQAPQIPVSDYAPRVQKVETFMALPLAEIDEAMAALTTRYEAAKARGQHIRDLIMEARAEQLAHLEWERAFAEFTDETFDALEQKYKALGRPGDQRPPYVKPTITEVTREELES